MKKFILILLICLLPVVSHALSVSPSIGNENTIFQVSGVSPCPSTPDSCWVGVFQQGLIGRHPISDFYNPVPAELVGYNICGYVGDARNWNWPNSQGSILTSNPYINSCDFSGSHNFKIVYTTGLGVSTASFTVSNFSSTANLATPFLPSGFNLNEGFPAAVAAVSGNVVNSIWFWLLLIGIGIPLVFYILEEILDFMGWQRKMREVDKIQQKAERLNRRSGAMLDEIQRLS